MKNGEEKKENICIRKISFFVEEIKREEKYLGREIFCGGEDIFVEYLDWRRKRSKVSWSRKNCCGMVDGWKEGRKDGESKGL